jgi:hypothetical protein
LSVLVRSTEDRQKNGRQKNDAQASLAGFFCIPFFCLKPMKLAAPNSELKNAAGSPGVSAPAQHNTFHDKILRQAQRF